MLLDGQLTLFDDLPAIPMDYSTHRCRTDSVTGCMQPGVLIVYGELRCIPCADMILRWHHASIKEALTASGCEGYDMSKLQKWSMQRVRGRRADRFRETSDLHMYPQEPWR